MDWSNSFCHCFEYFVSLKVQFKFKFVQNIVIVMNREHNFVPVSNGE